MIYSFSDILYLNFVGTNRLQKDMANLYTSGISMQDKNKNCCGKWGWQYQEFTNKGSRHGNNNIGKHLYFMFSQKGVINIIIIS